VISLHFIRRNGRLLGFGFFLCFLSSAGQTFFISLSGGEIRETFGLSHGEFGSIYSIATLASASVLMWAGGLIDRMDLKLYMSGVLLGLAGACALMWGTGGIVLLGVSIFCLRFFGQGLTSHAAITTMGRYFFAERGRAVGIASLGHTAGEAVLPPLVIAGLGLLYWQNVWAIVACVLVLCLVAARRLLGSPRAPDLHSGHGGATPPPDMTLAQVLKDASLWLRLPALLAPSFIHTGLIFHQIHVASEKGWTLTALAGAYSFYAVAALAMTLAGGWLVDRISARRLVPVFLLPLTAASLSLALIGDVLGIFAYMGFLGIGAGAALVMLGALWPELYGTRHLGAIKAFTQALMVFSSGLAPGAMGLLIDAGFTVEWIAAACAAYCVGASALSLAAGRRVRKVL